MSWPSCLVAPRRISYLINRYRRKMSKKKSQTPPKVFPPQDMGTIIRAFEGYALGDIEHNRSKPIAAFMLSICFLDQLSSFVYGLAIPNAERAQDLIDT